MTTRIGIVNLGPDPILVEPINRGEDGRFADGGNPIELAPGETFGFKGGDSSYVYDTRFFTVKEKPKG